MIDSLIKRYIWLIQTIRDAGENGIPFSEIQNKWDKASANDNHTPLISRTFHNHRNAILLQFGIEIKCNMSRENSYYYIEKSDLEGNTIVTWLINSMATESLLMDMKNIRGKVLLEHIPSGQEFFPVISQALRQNIRLLLSYKSFHLNTPTYTEVLIEPLCLKLFKRRWYLLAHNVEKNAKRIYALDRILQLKPTKQKFTYPQNFNPELFFDDFFGIATDSIINTQTPIKVILKTYREFSLYLLSLPLHHSQRLIEESDDYKVFEYRLIPTFDFMQELLSHGDYVEIIEPQLLRERMCSAAQKLLEMYDVSQNGIQRSGARPR